MRRTSERSETALVLSDLALSDEALRGLIDDWMVPALVEHFFSSERTFPESLEKGHNH
jgi:hypothetical protein